MSNGINLFDQLLNTATDGNSDSKINSNEEYLTQVVFTLLKIADDEGDSELARHILSDWGIDLKGNDLEIYEEEGYKVPKFERSQFPDLVIETDREIIFIENKIYAPLGSLEIPSDLDEYDKRKMNQIELQSEALKAKCSDEKDGYQYLLTKRTHTGMSDVETFEGNIFWWDLYESVETYQKQKLQSEVTGWLISEFLEALEKWHLNPPEKLETDGKFNVSDYERLMQDIAMDLTEEFDVDIIGSKPKFKICLDGNEYHFWIVSDGTLRNKKVHFGMGEPKRLEADKFWNMNYEEQKGYLSDLFKTVEEWFDLKPGGSKEEEAIIDEDFDLEHENLILNFLDSIKDKWDLTEKDNRTGSKDTQYPEISYPIKNAQIRFSPRSPNNLILSVDPDDLDTVISELENTLDCKIPEQNTSNIIKIPLSHLKEDDIDSILETIERYV